MPQKNFTFKIHEALQEKVIFSEARSSLLRKELIGRIESLDAARKEKRILLALSKVYQPVSSEQKLALKREILEKLPEKVQQTLFLDVQEFTLAFTKKCLALAFSLLLVSTSLFGTFEISKTTDFLPAVKAAYLACEGTVYLNNQLCLGNQLAIIKPGDAIKTESSSLATLYYPHLTIVRFENDTVASLDQKSQEQIYLEKGSVWLNSSGQTPQEGLKISTSVVNARIPNGSAGITSKGSVTELITATAAIEVQIKSNKNTTEVVALTPEKTLTVRKSRPKVRIKEDTLDLAQFQWIQNNQAKDLVDMASLKSTQASHDLAKDEVPKTIFEIHQLVSEGKVLEAEKSLKEALLSKNLENSFDATDMAMIDDIALKAPGLQDSLTLMKHLQITELRKKTPKDLAPETMATTVTGTAYKPTEEESEKAL